MNKFDYELYDVVGIVDILDNGNATIEVVGYVDHLGDYHKLSQQELAALFPPKKLVFAHNFIAKYRYDFQDCLVRLSVIPNKKLGEGYYAYIWDKSQDVYEFGAKVVKVHEQLSEDGEHNYSVLSSYNLLNKDDDVFISSSDKIFRILGGSKERIISYWYQSSLDLIKGRQEKLYIVNYDFPIPDGVIDITNDDQLIDWFLRKVLKPNWAEIMTNKSFKNIESHLKEALSSLATLDTSVYQSRMDRLKKMNVNFELSLQEVQDMAQFPWLASAIEKSVEKYQDKFIKDFDDQCKAKLQDRKKQLNDEILEAEMHKDDYMKKLNELTQKAENEYLDSVANLESQLELKKNEINNLNAEIETTEARKKKIDETLDLAMQRKDTIVQDFAIIKEVLGISGSSRPSNVYSDANDKTFHCAEYNLAKEPIDMFEYFKKSLETVFKTNNIKKESAWEIADIIAKYHVVLFPNTSLVNAALIAMKKCRYLTEYVSASWKSFADLWDNGLSYLVNECLNNQDIVHVLVLQNINMTYMPNFMQPLVDLQNRLITRFPGTDIELPDNLRIFCTITEDELIPLAPSCLKYIGCIDKCGDSVKEYYDRIIPGKDSFGYLSADILTDQWESNPDTQNHYKSYLYEGRE